MKHIKRLLVANRGEIAVRIIRTARQLGIHTITIHSGQDADAPHVLAADEAWHVEGSPPVRAYLNQDDILRVATMADADALHPGYGFLSENTGFARSVRERGIRFVGPAPEAISRMGDKSRAKAEMEAAGVPTVPGYHGDDQTAARLLDEARRMGFPVLIKASAGGGGKGMKVAGSEADFPDALDSAKREALSAFGSDHVLLEKYLPVARHVEVQLLCDHFGKALYVGDRDCSVQRRHQKILEEAPAPGLDDATRQAMGDAAVRCAKALDYRNAGTVEFLLAPDGNFYFMEVNTRLQVEHPVTEAVYGLDLVEWQLRIADDQPLPFSQSDIRATGHAIEARIYAEQPEKGFLPATGRLTALEWPDTVQGLRIDHALREGLEITPHFDPMLAKVIASAPSRDAALGNLYQALAHSRIDGVQTNVSYLLQILAHEDFRDARLDTRLCERVTPGGEPSEPEVVSQALAAWLHEARLRLDPVSRQWAFRSVMPVYEQYLTLLQGERRLHLAVRMAGSRVDAHSECGTFTFELLPGDRHGQAAIRLENGQTIQIRYACPSGRLVIYSPRLATFTLLEPDAYDPAGSEGGSDNLAPMTGAVVKVLAKPGDRLKSGDTVMVMEAMKMEHPVRVSRDGTLDRILVNEGDQVQEGQRLFEYTEGTGSEDAS